MSKRRANGEGNIRRRKDGRWEGRYTARRDPVTGKQIFKNVLGKTQAEVKEKLQKALAQAKKIDFAKTGKYTVAMWMNEWFENVAKIKVRPSSHQTYRGYIDHHIAPNIGNIPLEKLTTMDLQKLYRKLLNKGRVDRIEAKDQPKGLSAKTVRNINQVISSAMDFAVAQKIIPENPCKAAALPKVEHKEMQACCGSRQMRRPAKRTCISPTAATRSPPSSRPRRQSARSPSPKVGPISPDSVNNMLKRVLARAGIPKVRFHDLRHTFATIALQNGVDIKTVSGMLGHFSAGFTLDTYAHVTTAAQKVAADTMGNVLSV